MCSPEGCPAPQRCQYYLKRKHRCCAALAKESELYCGNHLSLVKGDGERVPCPHDPTHSMRRDDVQHLQCCPSLLHQNSIKAMLYYREDCNAGRPDFSEGVLEALDSHESMQALHKKQRSTVVNELGLDWLLDLISRVKDAHRQICTTSEPLSQLMPHECNSSMKPDNLRPFDERHAIQQASIAGNLIQAGLLEDGDEVAVVEFGAGKGYLSSMISDCTDVQQFILVDIQSFRLKADRSLRRAAKLQRAKVDIKDFDPQGIAALREGPWVAVGKHLCGAATDFTLRCCRNAIHQAGVSTPQMTQNGADCSSDSQRQQFRGLAVAPCCHHRCSWRHYVGKEMFLRHGFSALEFEIVSWMTGWALCGHDAPPGTAECESQPDSSHVTRASQSGEPQTTEACSTSGLVAGATTAASLGDKTPSHCWSAIPMPQRVDIGMKCKRLIDMGRLDFLQSFGFQAQSLLYVTSDVTGENRLLLASTNAKKTLHML